MHKFRKKCSTILAIFLLSGIINAQSPSKDFFTGRRNELYKKMESGVLILSGYKNQIQRNADSPSKQDYNFWYLTGYSAPDAVCLFAPKAEKKFVLFVRKMIKFRQTADGKEEKIDYFKEVMDEYGADAVYFNDEIENVVKRYLENENTVYCSYSDKELSDMVNKLSKDETGKINRKIIVPTQIISALRIVKTPEEIEDIKKAGDITTKAQIEAMKAAKPGVNEKIIEAVIDYVYKTNWASGIGFPSIIGSGPNSLIPHYDKNNMEMENGAVCVMDIGAAYNGYSADITRTIPVNGKFTPEQKDIYNAVLKSQKEAIKQFKPGTLPSVIEETAANVAKEEMLKLGLITDVNSKWQFRIWFLHGVSHSIGLDVHDATPASYYKDGMQPDMIFTIEPGIYVSESWLNNISKMRYGNIPEKELKDFIEKVRPAAKKYNNIGIRIEDDVLITKDGNIIITNGCPKEIADIEKTMKQKSRFTD